MIEVVVQPTVGHFLPADCVVARRATFVLETSLVRICVTVVALAERQTLVTRSPAGIGRMALLALHLLVQSGQRIAGLVVIKLSGSILPIDEVVALQAILTKTAFVEVLVASHASLRDPEERLAQVLHLDLGALGGRDFVGGVALVACQTGVLAFKQIPGLLVVELILIPLDESEIYSVVIGVAAHALLARAGRNMVGTVQSPLSVDSLADVSVAAAAFELRLSATNFVTVCAVQCTVEILVRPGEGAGRNLRGGGNRQRTKNS